MTRRWTDGEKVTAGALGVAAAGGLWWAMRRTATAPSGAPLALAVPLLHALPLLVSAKKPPVDPNLSTATVTPYAPPSPEQTWWAYLRTQGYDCARWRGMTASDRLATVNRVFRDPRSPELGVVSEVARDALNAACGIRHRATELLASCPTNEEILRILNTYRASIGGGTMPYACTPGGTEWSETLFVINLFRLAELVNFDAPIPLLNATNLGEWLRAQRFSGIYFSTGNNTSMAGRLDHRAFDVTLIGLGYTSREYLRSVVAPMILVHEGWHIVSGKNHPCDRHGQCCTETQMRSTGCPLREFVNDPSLEYGGAWAAHFWYLRWLSRHSGDYLSPEQRQFAEEMAETVRGRFAHRPTDADIARLEAPYLAQRTK